MKVLPATLLALLSADSSILPSAAVNESSSGVARKLNSKAEKSDEDDELKMVRQRIVMEGHLLTASATIIRIFDTNLDGKLTDGEVADFVDVLANGPFGVYTSNVPVEVPLSWVMDMMREAYVGATFEEYDELNGALGYHVVA